MSEQDHKDWGSPVTFDIAHHYACPCCDGTGATEYSLVIIPSHLQGAVPLLRLYEDELEFLLKLIARVLRRGHITRACNKTEKNIGKDDDSVSFDLIRNKNGQKWGEYSLHVVGRGVDDILPVDGAELRRLVKQVGEMKQVYGTLLSRLAKIEDRQIKVTSRMKGKTLDQIADEVRRVNPCLWNDARKVIRVLLAAAFFVGPDIKRLVWFTGYSRSFVADISCRMHDSGLWANGEAYVEHWFDDELEFTEFGLVQDCGVADGLMVAWRDGEYGKWSFQDSGRGKEWSTYAP